MCNVHEIFLMICLDTTQTHTLEEWFQSDIFLYSEQHYSVVGRWHLLYKFLDFFYVPIQNLRRNLERYPAKTRHNRSEVICTLHALSAKSVFLSVLSGWHDIFRSDSAPKIIFTHTLYHSFKWNMWTKGTTDVSFMVSAQRKERVQIVENTSEQWCPNQVLRISSSIFAINLHLWFMD